MDSATLLAAFVGLVTLWTSTATSFALTIKREFWKTFSSNMTAKEYAIACFQASTDPYIKCHSVFDNHRSFTASIKAEVMIYTKANWAIWERTKPEWFTTKFISCVGDEFIPERSLEALNAFSVAGRRDRRRSSSLAALVNSRSSQRSERSGVRERSKRLIERYQTEKQESVGSLHLLEDVLKEEEE